ncbi:hypothetical protein C1637_11465 [Chryseobacterium lactis]|uniref:DUF805 domain-containing protein n=1 Tax=Chryseobacterium lactis TaxID=1241981 RepID=A0A3G6RLT0_CHRLC|nr:hypothetical protein EG342_02475 [Chryseobacterium lactis]AZB05845.1 hypothetical protein EG341_18600 [Chryseobacterium lactis]PNW13435.1 hypothetical protein C1637_11465 [Chryseobacterium lactis]
MRLTIIMENQHFKMIRFIRLLFYHIYTFYCRKEGKSIAKFSTFAVFLVIIALLTISIHDLFCQYYDNNYTSLSGGLYILVWVITGVFIAYYLYREGFRDFNEYYDINRKYYYYFLIIVLFTLCLVIYTGKVSRKRIFKQREIEKERVENRKNNIKVN